MITLSENYVLIILSQKMKNLFYIPIIEKSQILTFDELRSANIVLSISTLVVIVQWPSCFKNTF